jgi:hypothetical protein
MAGPPDRNFDHANFYWRMELQPEMQVTSHGNASLGNASLGMTENAYRGATARITRGTGAGQERAITANNATGLTVAPPWDVEPDGTSFFTVAEAGWHFGAVAKSSPVEFAIPNRPGEVVQLSGHAANVNDLESAPELAIVTRWQIGGTAGEDGAVPAAPQFGVGAGPHGSVQLTGVSFPDLSNTSTISSATLTLHYRDELQGTAPCALAVPAGAGDSALTLDGAGPAAVGAIVQIEGEILRVTAVNDAKTAYTVERGIHGSAVAAHAAQSAVWHLQSKVAIAPFPSEFFGSPYSGSWSFAVPMPDARVGSAELVVTNRYGNSPATGICLTHNDDAGLRTLSGGQYSIQVDGYLAVDSTVSAPLVVEAAHAVRDVFAVLGTAADAPVGVQVNLNGAAYCTLNFAAGMTVSSAANGNALPPLPSGSRITVSVLSTGATNPGADLTVVVRL